MSRLLVLGRGYLGREFERYGHTVVGRDGFQFDPDDPGEAMEQLVDLLHRDQPDAVVNCIGCADTRACEDLDNWDNTFQVNTMLPAHLSEWLEYREETFVHISTGCLYDGQTGVDPATEESPLETHCHYTVSKQAGENNCNKEHDLILRPRLLFSDREHPANLLTKLQKFDRFINAPNSYTSLRTIVEATESLVLAKQVGVFNVAQDVRAMYLSPWDIARNLGIKGEEMSVEELREEQGIYLVNNVMDINKLRQFYEPRVIGDEIAYSWSRMKNLND